MSNEIANLNTNLPANLEQMFDADLRQQDAMTPQTNLPPFRRIKLPQGGGTMFKVETGKNVFAEVNQLIVHIVHIQEFRQQWLNKAVICQSDDGVRSRNTPKVRYANAVCEVCPDAQFQPLPGGKQVKPKCSKKARLYMIPCLVGAQFNGGWAYPVDETGKYVMEGVGKEPCYIDLPPTSLKSLNEFFKRCEQLSAKRVPYTAAIARLTCTESKSSDGQSSFSKVDIAPIAITAAHMYAHGKKLIEDHKLKLAEIHDDEDHSDATTVTPISVTTVQANPAPVAQTGVAAQPAFFQAASTPAAAAPAQPQPGVAQPVQTAVAAAPAQVVQPTVAPAAPSASPASVAAGLPPWMTPAK